jgi:hypothetical protein
MATGMPPAGVPDQRHDNETDPAVFSPREPSMIYVKPALLKVTRHAARPIHVGY